MTGRSAPCLQGPVASLVSVAGAAAGKHGSRRCSKRHGDQPEDHPGAQWCLTHAQARPIAAHGQEAQVRKGMLVDSKPSSHRAKATADDQLTTRRVQSSASRDFLQPAVSPELRVAWISAPKIVDGYKLSKWSSSSQQTSANLGNHHMRRWFCLFTGPVQPSQVALPSVRAKERCAHFLYFPCSVIDYFDMFIFAKVYFK
ncbi:hypothetical protein HPB50_029188 [Hyalomma asiaticum]|nr:hypothetical protein HPB50_029188 [Hyalomma asiaticum]